MEMTRREVCDFEYIQVDALTFQVDKVAIQVDEVACQVDGMQLQVVQNPNINKLMLNSIC